MLSAAPGHRCLERELPLVGAHNLTGGPLPAEVMRMLNLGLRFRPTPAALPLEALEEAIERLARRLRFIAMYGNDDPVPKFRVAKPWVRPRRGPRKLEEFITRLRGSLLKAHAALAASPPPPSCNLPRRDLAALRQLRAAGYIVKPADKNLGLTIMRKPDYQAALMAIVSDPAVYREVTGRAAPLLNAAVARLQAAVKVGKDRGTLSKPTREYLLSAFGAREPPYLYGMPKLHSMGSLAQRPIPMRPIAAAHSFFTTPASRYLADALNACLPLFPAILPDRDTLLQQLAGLRIPHDAWLVTFDVASLYPSLDHRGCMTACSFALRQAGRTPAEVDTLIGLLDVVLTSSVVTVGDRHYWQVRGGAMGTNCMPPVAQLFLAVLVEMPLRAAMGAAFPKHYWRFIDDGVFVFTGTEAQLDAFLARLGSAHPNIRITHARSQLSITFMDLVISKRLTDTWLNPTGLVGLSTRTHQKARNRYLYIPWHSFHSTSMLGSFIHGELQRYARTCSSEPWFNTMRNLFALRLLRRGYPRVLLQDAFARVQWHTARAAFLASQPGARPAAAGRPAPPVLVLPYMQWAPELRAGRLLYEAYAAGGPLLHAIITQRPRVAYTRTANIASTVSRASHFH